MKYNLEVAEHIHKKFKKIFKKDRKQLEIVNRKVDQIRLNPYQFKPLRGDMHGSWRVHIDKSFVLIYEIDEKRRTVRILDYDHHDKVY
jgi:YafQ family addiction module toxin component